MKFPKAIANLHFSPMVPQGYMEGIRSGVDLLKSGDYARAEKLFYDLSYKWGGRCAGNYLFVLHLAEALLLQGKLDDAEMVYRDLVETSKVESRANYGLALVLRKTNREAESKRHLEIAKIMGSNIEIPEYLPSLE